MMTEEQKAALEKTLGMIAQQLENLSLRVNILEMQSFVATATAPAPTVLWEGNGSVLIPSWGGKVIQLAPSWREGKLPEGKRVRIVITEVNG